MSRKINEVFEAAAPKITCWSGSSPAFLIAFTVEVIWAVIGHVFDYSET